MREGFDFIYSIAVLQHVPCNSGRADNRDDGGAFDARRWGAINVVLAADRRSLDSTLLMTWPLAHNVLNLVRGRDWSYPVHADERLRPESRLADPSRSSGLQRCT